MICLLLCLATSLVDPGPAQQGSSAAQVASAEWPGIRANLVRLQQPAALNPAERELLLASLHAWQERAPAGFERELVHRHLARAQAQAAAPLDPKLLPFSLRGEDAWLAALVLAPGTERTHCLTQALGEIAPEHLPALLVLAFESFGAEIAAKRLENAEKLAVAMRIAQPLPWSASTLGVLWTRLGKYDAAEELLTQEVTAQAARVAELEQRWLGSPEEALRESLREDLARARADYCSMLERRAVARIGAGRDDQAQHDLGRALSLGGRDAAQILGQQALARGQDATAVQLFRSLLLPRPGEDASQLQELAPWANRGWGLALQNQASHSHVKHPPSVGR